jgi:YfiH family protein
MNYLTTNLEKMPWLRHGFFTRHGGVSGGLYNSLNCGWKADDDPNFLTNRARAAAALGFLPEQLVVAKQVHGIKIVPVIKPWKYSDFFTGGVPEADGMVTAERGIALGILTADCAPVLFAAKKEKIIGACHAGWKGSVAGVLEATVDAMKNLGAKPENIHAALGPCIGPQSYEVKDDFAAPFLAQDKSNAQFFREGARPGHLIFNLPGYVIHRLNLAGVKTIHDTKQDTLTGEAFFSNRRAFLKGDKGFGLQVSVIGMG